MVQLAIHVVRLSALLLAYNWLLVSTYEPPFTQPYVSTAIILIPNITILLWEVTKVVEAYAPSREDVATTDNTSTQVDST